MTEKNKNICEQFKVYNGQCLEKKSVMFEFCEEIYAIFVLP